MSKQRHALRKHDKLQVVIESMAGGGQGVAKHEGVPIFVHRGVPGDRVEIELVDVRKDFAHGRITNVIQPSDQRREPPCKLFKVCGGCQWQHIEYENQTRLKTDIVRQVLSRIGGVDPALVRDTLSAPDELFYRNKVQFPVAHPRDSRRILAGYYKEGSHELVNIKHCPVQPEPLDHVLEAAKDLCEEFGISAYDEQSHTGLLRHIAARYSFCEDEILLTFVINAVPASYEGLAERFEAIADGIKEAVPQVIGVCVNFNSQRGNRIMGERTDVVAGREYLVEKLRSQIPNAPDFLQNGLSFHLSSQSFFQVNTAAAVVLFDLVFAAVEEFAKKQGRDKLDLIVDAYGGIGTIGIWVSSLAHEVVSIDEVKQAIENGMQALALNDIKNVELRRGTVEEVLPVLGELGLNPDIVILDPPRAGASRAGLDAVMKLAPKRIVYVSCDPATLARDLKILATEGGYKVLQVQPVDLFPQTFHVESVAVLDL